MAWIGPGSSGAHGLTRPRGRGILALFALLLLPPALHAAPLIRPERVIFSAEGTAPFRVPRGLAFDRERGDLVVANTGAHRIEIFSSRTGRLLGRFVHRVRGADGSWADGLPRSVAVLPSGIIAVTDILSPLVDLVDRRGRSVGTVALPFSAPGPPAALCVSDSGELFVAGPPGDDRVYRLSAAMAITATWGVSGREPGQLRSITAIASVPGGGVVVACAQTQLAVQLFTGGGEFQTGFGRHDIGHGNASLVSGVAVTPDGRIWVADELRQIVQVFDSSGGYLGLFGGVGFAAGDLNYPSALASDGRNRLAVAEREIGRVQLLITDGGGGEGPANDARIP
jgi:DNA-binding beta-propeller fold protein YncE